MKEVKTTTRYRKDFKRYSNDLRKVKKLFRIVELLRNEEPVPEEFRPHVLTGNYSGFMECHIENDFLLVWLEDDAIVLSRLGSHSELFK